MNGVNGGIPPESMISKEDFESLSPLGQVNARQKAMDHLLFEALIWDNWLGSLWVSLNGHEVVHEGGEPLTEPRFITPEEVPGSYAFSYVGGSSLWDARRHKQEATGETIDNDRLKELVEEVLKDELDRYNIELRWFHRRAWDGSDWILCIYPKSDVAEVSPEGQAKKDVEDDEIEMEQDAPLCMTCGSKMKPAGSCYVCESCGSTQGTPT